MRDKGAHPLAASVAAALRVALHRWIRPAGGSASGLVVLSGSLSDHLRAALAPLTPAFDAAENRRKS